MTFVRRLALTVLALLFAFAPGIDVAAKAKPARVADSAPAYKGAVIMDASSGQFIFEDHQGEPSPPASMTKLMTFLVLHDKLLSGDLTLQTPVTVAASDSKIGGTQVWLKEKEVFSVDELLYAMMIQSANDAAHALARTAAGSAEAFVALMNAKAAAIGMTHTTFRTPHGLPPSNRRLSEGDLTTPHDFALLCRELLLKTNVLNYASVKTREFGKGLRAEPVVMNNHNHLLGKISGVDGLKTGFTNGAGFCLAATAQRNGRRIIVVVMGSQDRKIRDIKVAELIERGFAGLPAGGPAFKAESTSRIVTAPAAPASPISAAPPEAGETSASGEPVIKFSVPTKRK
ncbi:MAG: D-alanyl-D-alanine carboxypeptidase family protein [Opitutus sp.]